jgi:PAS domain S-box-containing protein
VKRSPSIRTQIALLLIGATVLVVATGGYALYADYRSARVTEERRLQEVVELAASAIGQFLDDTESTAAALAARPTLRTMDATACGAFVREANEVLHQYTNVFVVDSLGDLVCSAMPPSEPESSAVGAPWWDRARESDGFVVGSPQMGRLSRVPVVVFGHPIRRQDGAIVGWVGLSANALVRFRDLVAGPGITPDVLLTLAEYDGTVISRSVDAEEWVGRELPGAESGAAQADVDAGTAVTVDAEGVRRVWAFRNLPEREWRIFAGIPLSDIQSVALRQARPNVLLLLALLALLLLVATRLQGSITAALDSLQIAVRSAARGRTDTVPVEGPAEVAEVASQFNLTLQDRARALAAERRIRQQYQSILNNAIFGIFISTPDGRVVEANPALARMLGEEGAGNVLSRNMNDLYARPADRARLVADALAGARTTAEVEWKRKDGTSFPVRLNWNVIRLPDGQEAFEVIAEDLTERRTLEQQLRQAQKLEAVGRLAGGVAHDFNNRLTVISGQAELMMAELRADSPLREHAEAIMGSARRAADLTAQLLAFSRRQVARPRPLDLEVVVRGVDLVLKRLVGEEVELATDLQPVGSVRADPGQVEQILLNLCTNARDAMPEGGRITISTEQRRLSADAARTRVDAVAGDYGVLVVTDTGQGMDEETRQRVFEPFFTTKPPGKGTGLGLSTVYGITVQSGGHLRVYSWPGKGTRFEIWLPIAADGELLEPLPEAGAAPPPPRMGGRETILVAEDEDPVRRIVVTTLARAGYQVLEAPDGPNALSTARDHEGPIHLLVTDVVMPGMRGPELAERLARARTGVRVLFISGYTDQADLGGDGNLRRAFLAKPFTPEELRTVVRVVLDDDPGTDPAVTRQSTDHRGARPP